MDIMPFFRLAASLYFYVEAGQADLKKYLKRFTVLGENLEKSGMNLEQVELNAKSTLIRK